jgi:two-component system alkaline phosphatase synthesis response regulator PhoP
MKVLVCDAEAVLLSAIEFRLRKYGFTMVQTTLKDAPQQLERHQPDLIILDTEHTPAQSVQFLQSLKQTQPELPIIMVSPLENEEELWQALQHGADDFVTKPFKLIELVLRVRKLLQQG